MIISGADNYSQDQLAHGQPGVTLLGYLATSRFWFESFQNWQSEFLAVAVLVGASVYLREKGPANQSLWRSPTTRQAPE